MSLPQIATVRRFLEEYKLDAVEVLAVLLRTMMAEHVAVRRMIDSGALPAEVLEVIEAAEQEAEENCQAPPSVTILEKTHELLGKEPAPIDAGPLAIVAPSAQPPQDSQALSDRWYVVRGDIHELLGRCVDTADAMCDEDQPQERREAA
jgi:hypothetical protein